MYWRASIIDEQGDVIGQVRELDRLVRAFPASSFAADARLSAAVETGRAGRTAEALTRLEAITRAGTADQASEAARWHAVFRAGTGTAAAPAIAAAAYDPTSLGAILDRSATDVQQPLPPIAFAETGASNVDTSMVAEWMTSTFGAPGPALTADAERTLALGFELVAAGEDTVGRRILSIAIAQRGERPHDLLEVARAAGTAGLPDIQAQAAVTLLNQLTPQHKLEAPKAVLRLAYPLAYAPETIDASQRAGVPALLLLALVRQESMFYPRAGSSAGAFGLAQLMPGTADDTAKSLGLPLPTPAQLADPATSLRLGAHYLGVQLRAFDGNVPAALSAYNGGPGNASRWQRDHSPRSFDGLLWSTDFSETRSYLEHVLENYAWYRYIYVGSPLSIR